MKIYINNPSENWVVDRLRREWYQHNKNNSAKNIFFSDIVWIISPWTFKTQNFKLLKNKKIVYSIHHIEEEEKSLFLEKLKKIDKYIDCYHTISKKYIDTIQTITNKKIHYIPFWIDSKIWFNISDKKLLRKKFGLNSSSFFVGSFQRDSLRINSNLPKLIKGPDIFLDNVIALKERIPNLEVVLTGRKRDYLINELTKANIKFNYFEMVNQAELNELYNCLDLYIVSSRVEGGPQAIPECALTKTPIVSTDVGMANDFMSPVSIYEPSKFLESKPDLDYLINKAEKLKIPTGFDEFLKMFDSI